MLVSLFHARYRMRERRRRRGRCEARREKSAQKGASKKKDVIQRNSEEYSLKKQENKILSREQPICFLQVESRHVGFQNKLEVKTHYVIEGIRRFIIIR